MGTTFLIDAPLRHDTLVVLYSRDTTAAARAAVLLMYAGVEDVRVLDGGFAAWIGADLPIETTVHLPMPVTDFGKVVPVHPEYMMDTEATKAFRMEPHTALVSIRSWAEYIGTLGRSQVRNGVLAGTLSDW